MEIGQSFKVVEILDKPATAELGSLIGSHILITHDVKGQFFEYYRTVGNYLLIKEEIKLVGRLTIKSIK